MILDADVGSTQPDLAWLRAGPEGLEGVTMRRTACERHAGRLDLLHDSRTTSDTRSTPAAWASPIRSAELVAARSPGAGGPLR